MMRLTKHEHACLVVTTADSALVVDPGAFTLPLDDLAGVVAVVITHEHDDHWTPEHLQRILDRSPDAIILGPPGVVAAAPGFPVRPVADGDVIEAGPFSIRFFGRFHALIHESIPVVDNVGVLINEALYYGGDSYTIPPVAVDTLAIPIGAPWLKIGDVMDYVAAIKPKRAFPTHEMVLSVIGKNMAHARVKHVTTTGNGEFFPLEPGDSLDL